MVHARSAALAAVALTSFAVVNASPAEARWRGGPAFALGAVGGLALGSALAARPYYGPRYGYYGYAPAYYARACYVVRRRFIDEFGDVYIRRTRVCD